VAHMTVSDLDSGSQGQVECKLESEDEVTRNSFSLHRYEKDTDHFRFVWRNKQNSVPAKYCAA